MVDLLFVEKMTSAVFLGFQSQLPKGAVDLS